MDYKPSEEQTGWTRISGAIASIGHSDHFSDVRAISIPSSVSEKTAVAIERWRPTDSGSHRLVQILNNARCHFSGRSCTIIPFVDTAMSAGLATAFEIHAVLADPNLGHIGLFNGAKGDFEPRSMTMYRRDGEDPNVDEAWSARDLMSGRITYSYRDRDTGAVDITIVNLVNDKEIFFKGKALIRTHPRTCNIDETFPQEEVQGFRFHQLPREHNDGQSSRHFVTLFVRTKTGRSSHVSEADLAGQMSGCVIAR